MRLIYLQEDIVYVMHVISVRSLTSNAAKPDMDYMSNVSHVRCPENLTRPT